MAAVVKPAAYVAKRSPFWGLILGLALGCGDERESSRDAGGCVRLSCLWNPVTQAYDRDCRIIAPPDGGFEDCDGGADFRASDHPGLADE